MITKVTSANYDAYTLLFNQADAALKEAQGEPTSEFLEVSNSAAFNPNVQYFDQNYSPVTFEAEGNFATAAAAFEGRDLTVKWYTLNEKAIYDLDTYFGRLRLLSDIDYSFLRLPLDEPTFDIVDDASQGRRVIKVPDDFAKNGVSVQGDETAEILFFSVDRYYDSTDLWAEGMHYIIQWKTGTKNGVTRAFLNKDGRPFIDDDGKLYFGWPLSSDITNEAGNVTFSVRIYKFSDNVDASGKPILAFGLNTQTANVKVNSSLTFEFKNTTEFEDAEVYDRNSSVIGRIVNSTVINKGSAQAASVPRFDAEVGGINILTDEDLATSIATHTISYDVYTLASGIFDPEETYYNVAHEPVELNENIYIANVYYTKSTPEFTYYEFEAEDVIDKIQQVQAIVDSGIITYTNHSQKTPYDSDAGGNATFVGGDAIVYAKVTSETKQANHKYYVYNENLRKFMPALDIVTETGQTWVDADRKNGVSDGEVLYYERFSPQLVINENNPVGCYWIIANNNDGKKAMSTADSYRIWIPGPVDLVEETNFNDEAFEKIHIDSEDEATLGLSLNNIAANNTVVYEWFKKNDQDVYEPAELSSLAEQVIEYDEADLALANDFYKVEAHTLRNKQHSTAKLSKEFRITDNAHSFVFDLEPTSAVDSKDDRKVLIRSYRDEDAEKYVIDFSENLDGNDKLNIVSDSIAYRFRVRSGADTDPNVFYNDTFASNWTPEHHFVETTFDELKEMEFILPENGKYFYVELINIVNEDFDLDALNAAADALAEEVNITTTAAWQPFEDRIARTPYVIVED